MCFGQISCKVVILDLYTVSSYAKRQERSMDDDSGVTFVGVVTVKGRGKGQDRS